MRQCKHVFITFGIGPQAAANTTQWSSSQWSAMAGEEAIDDAGGMQGLAAASAANALEKQALLTSVRVELWRSVTSKIYWRLMGAICYKV